jgi:amidase
LQPPNAPEIGFDAVSASRLVWRRRMRDLMFMSVGDLATHVRGGELSAREVTTAALERIEALEPVVNAFVEVDSEGALAAADAIEPGDERPFAGVPIAIKANVPVAGLTMNFGSKFLGDHRPSHNAYLVRRLQEAGFVIVGVTNMPEFGILPTTEPRHTGPTRNPWDTGRTPGGSSGGAAAAVASGMLPVAHGNDGGGSLRIPASCCGLVGLKPSRGRVSRGPDLGDSYLASDGVLTHTVAETAMLLDVLSGYEVGDATWAPRPVEPYTKSYRRDPGRLRIAMTADNVLGADVDPECLRGMRETGELLAALGHHVVEDAPALPGEDTLRIFTGVFGPAIALGVAYGEQLAGRAPEDDEIEPLSRVLSDISRGMSSIEYLAALAQMQALARGVIAFFAEYDVLLTPALAERPLAIGECDGLGEDPMADFARSGAFTPFTALFNVTGQPAISVPAGFGEDGLPTNAQIVAKPLGEDTLLQLAAQIETARPADGRRPELAA